MRLKEKIELLEILENDKDETPELILDKIDDIFGNGALVTYEKGMKILKRLRREKIKEQQRQEFLIKKCNLFDGD